MRTFVLIPGAGGMAAAAGYDQEFTETVYFLHDVPAEVLADEEALTDYLLAA